jgi:hypothetical protein
VGYLIGGLIGMEEKKCETEEKQIIVHKGYHIWWCKTHKQPIHLCDKERAVKEAIILDKRKLENMFWIPCCHTSGMHDPEHFEKRKYICDHQKAESLERFCKEVGINPRTRSKPYCGWCKEYAEYRDGEGLRLFDKKQGGGNSSQA